MTTGARITKQIIIAVFLFAFIGGLGFWLFRGVINPPPPTPAPNPTARLLPVNIVLTKLLNVQNSDYDFVAKVYNPNTDYGSPAVAYAINFYNLAGSLVDTKTASFYILPGQTKYIINAPLKFTEPIARADMAIKSIDWQQLDPLGAAGVSLIAKNYNYVPVGKQGVFGKVGGSVLNNSDYDLGRVDITVLLFDPSDTVIAVNRTEIRTFLAKTTRGFEVSWFTPFADQVNHTEIETSTNPFENSNFLQRFQKPERFQEYY